MAHKPKKSKHPVSTPYGLPEAQPPAVRKWRTAAWSLGLVGLVAVTMGHFLYPELPRFLVWLLGLVCAGWAVTVFVLATHWPEEDELALRVQKGVHLDFGKALRESRQKRRQWKLPLVGEVTVRQISGVGIFVVVFVWWLTPWAPIRVAQRKLEDPAQVLAEEILSPVLVLTDPYWPMVQLPMPSPKMKKLAGYLPAGPSRLDRAWKLLADGQFDEARHQFQAVMEESTETAVLDRAMLGLAQTEMYRWNFSAARENYEKLLQRNRQNPFLLGQAAIAAVYQARYAEAAQWLDEALKLSDSGSQTPPEKLPVLVGLLHGKATVLSLWGRSASEWEEASKLYGRAKELLSQPDQFGPSPPQLAAVVNNQCVLLQLRSRFAGVQALHHQARSLWEHSLGPAHLHVADSWTNLAMCRIVLGEYALAEEAIQSALAVLQKQPGISEESPLWGASRSAASLFARTYARYQEAETTALQALRSFEQCFGPDHPAVVGPVCALTLFYGELAQYIASATPFMLRAEAICGKNLGKDHPFMAVIQLGQAELLLIQKQYPAAKDAAEKALKLALATHGEEHLLTAAILNTLAQAKLELGQTAEARTHLEKARRILEKAIGKDAPEMIENQVLQAALHSGPVTYRTGLHGYKQAISMLENLFGQHREHPAIARLHVRAARLLVQNRRPAEAKEFLQRAREIQEKVFAQIQPNHPDLADSLELYADLLEQSDPPDPAQAEKLRQQARQIRLRHQQEDRLKAPGS